MHLREDRGNEFEVMKSLMNDTEFTSYKKERKMSRGSRGALSGSRVESGGRLGGGCGVKKDFWGIPCGHQVGLMSLLMIRKEYMPAYK